MHARRNGFLERDAYNRVSLIHDLAEGTLTNRALATKYGAESVGTISQFKAKHKAEIEQAREAIGNKLASLLIADKQWRLAQYQDTVGHANDEVALVLARRVVFGTEDADGEDAEDGALVADVSGALARLWRARDRALRSASEELGQLPTRTTVQITPVTIRHIVEGVNIDKL